MKSSINGPLSGSVPVILVVEKYIKLLRTLSYTSPPKSLLQLYTFSTGFTRPVDSSVVNSDRESTKFVIDKFYRSRLRGNTIALIEVLSDYIKASLNMLDHIPQGRQSLDLDMTKSIKYYYNLSRHAAKEIRILQSNVKRGIGISRADLNRFMQRVSYEAAMTFSQIGSVSPNPRCDNDILTLLDTLTPKFIDVASASPKQYSVYADLLKMYCDITRLYYGAVNISDRTPQHEMNGPAPLDTEEGNGPLRISNAVVACLPAPSIDMLRSFHDPEAQVVSPEALDYVSYLENSYIRRS